MKVSLLLGIALLVFGVRGMAGTPPKTDELVAAGKAAYTTNCVTCHGDKGDGEGPAGKYMNPKPRNFAKDKFKKGTKVEEVYDVVTNGLKDTTMNGFPTIGEKDRWGVAYYVLSLRGDTGGKGGKKK